MNRPNWYEVILSWLGDVSLANVAVVISQLEATFILRLAGGGHSIPRAEVAARLQAKNRRRKSWIAYCREVHRNLRQVDEGNKFDMSLTRDSALACVALAVDVDLFDEVLDGRPD